MTVMDDLKAAMYTEKESHTKYSKFALDTSDPEAKTLFERMARNADQNQRALQARIQEIQPGFSVVNSTQQDTGLDITGAGRGPGQTSRQNKQK